MPTRILTALLLLACVPAHAIDPCPGKIMTSEERKTFIETQIQGNIEEADALIQSKFTEYTQKTMNEKIAATCDAKGYCTAEQVQMVVMETWKDVLEKAIPDAEPGKLAKIKNYTLGSLFVLSSVVAGSYGIAFSKDALTHLNPGSPMWKETVNVAMNVFSMAVVVALAAPVSKTLSAFAEKIGFGIFQGKNIFKKKKSINDYLNIVFMRSKAKMTDTQGAARSVLNNFGTILQSRTKDAVDLLLYQDSEQNRKRAATFIVDLLKLKRKRYPELHYDDKEIVSDMHLFFVESIPSKEVREDIAGRAFKLLPKYDEDMKDNSDITELYKKMLRTWLIVDLPV